MDGISVANTMFVEFHETNPSRISQCWSRELVLLVASGARSTISANSEMCACFFQQAKIFFFASCSCHPFFLSFFLFLSSLELSDSDRSEDSDPSESELSLELSSSSESGMSLDGSSSSTFSSLPTLI